MDQTAPDALPPISDQRQPAIAAPESEPRAALPPAPDAPEAPTTGTAVAAPPDGSVAITARPLRLSSARRRALRRRRRRIRLGLFCAVLLGALFAGPSQNDWIAAATNAREAWRYDRALAFYQQAMRRDPADPRPYCLTGEVLALQQENRAASAAYAHCRALGEDTAAVALALGDLANARGDGVGAQREWQHSISRGGTTARRRLALWHEARGEFDDAALQWQALGANDGQAREHLGMLALRVADYVTAQRDFLA
ncbi:MAG TPA: hypothetical protein VGR57_07220, partial [Ktedonobacterales bacterium]|nr:hypothetical protein [Ktedonobacterales bacterium]